MIKRVGSAVALLAMAAIGTAAGAAQVYSNDFGMNAAGFTGGTITTAPNGQRFLNFGGAGGTATLTLTGLAAHSTVSLAFSLYAIGSMDGNVNVVGGGAGDYFTVDFSGASETTIFNRSFANFGGGETQSNPTQGSAPTAGAATINALGYSGFPTLIGVQDAEYNFSLLPITDASGSISFIFTDNSNEGAGNEFYGIDNVVVTTATATGAPGAVPEPATWATMLLGFGAIGAAKRRQKVAFHFA